MDCKSAGNAAAGIDPKILDNWQTEGIFSLSWDHSSLEHPREWEVSQHSSSSDTDFADLGVLDESFVKHEKFFFEETQSSHNINCRCAVYPPSPLSRWPSPFSATAEIVCIFFSVP